MRHCSPQSLSPVNSGTHGIAAEKKKNPLMEKKKKKKKKVRKKRENKSPGVVWRSVPLSMSVSSYNWLFTLLLSLMPDYVCSTGILTLGV